MLPFLRPKKSASVVSVVTKSDGSSKTAGHEGETPSDRMNAAEKLIAGMHAKDATAVAEALEMHHKAMQAPEPEESNEG